MICRFLCSPSSGESSFECMLPITRYNIQNRSLSHQLMAILSPFRVSVLYLLTLVSLTLLRWALNSYFHFRFNAALQTAPYLFLACAVIFNCKKCSLKKIALVFPLAAFTIASSMFAGQCLSILPLQTYLSIRQGTALVIFLILVLQGHVRDFGRKIMCLVGILIGALILGGSSLINTSRVQYLYGLLFSLSEAGSLLLCAYLWRKKLQPFEMLTYQAVYCFSFYQYLLSSEQESEDIFIFFKLHDIGQLPFILFLSFAVAVAVLYFSKMSYYSGNWSAMKISPLATACIGNVSDLILVVMESLLFGGYEIHGSFLLGIVVCLLSSSVLGSMLAVQATKYAKNDSYHEIQF